MSTAIEFLTWFWEDLQRWLASPHRLKESRTASMDVNGSVLAVFQHVDRKAIEFLVLFLVLVPTLGYFLGKAGWAVFRFWFGMYG